MERKRGKGKGKRGKIKKEKDTEALIADPKVPEVNSEVISRDKGLSITIDRYGVYMVGVGVGVHSFGNMSKDPLLGHKFGELQLSLRRVWRGHCSQLFLIDFPEFDGLICWRMSVQSIVTGEARGRKRRKVKERPLVERRRWALFCLRHHRILLIFSSISKLLR